MSQARFSGVLAPVITPFSQDLSPDSTRFVKHCQWIVSQGANLAVFGTNSEANSLSVSEKISLLEDLINGGVQPGSLMPGTGCCALSDTIELTRKAVEFDCGGVLMLPPFYYKGVSDEGLYDYYAEVIEAVDSENLNIYLYHIPPISQIPLSVQLIEKLAQNYPKNIAGIKDSSGDWNQTKAFNELAIDNKKPLLGICVGLQMFADIGYEETETKGLGWVSGKVSKIDNQNNKYKLPHIGWNEINIVKDSKIFKDIENNSHMYFVHSYEFIPEDKNVISATTDYSSNIVCSIEKENIFGTQFHPEKSDKVGLQIISNFINL